MREFKVNEIGKVKVTEEGFFIKIAECYKSALTALEDFQYINVLWWFDRCDNEKERNTLEIAKPYKKGPAVLGVFATRSPERPNPIAVSTAYVINVDKEKGEIQLAYLEAFDNTPVLDIKPYIPSVDRVEEVVQPGWCSNWPENIETSDDFNWEDEFNF